MQAAHCIRRESTYQYIVTAGRQIINSTGGISSTAFKHPNYTTQNPPYDYDLALLKLHEPLNYSEAIVSIDMIQKGEETPIGTNCMISGWGKTENSFLSNQLLAANITIVNRTICEKTLNALEAEIKITDRMICAGGEKEDACHGTRA